MTIREALLAMEYREAKPGIWLKPVGYVCFTYSEAKNEWANRFVGAVASGSKIECWNSNSFKKDSDPLAELKYFEYGSRTDIDSISHFELVTIDL